MLVDWVDSAATQSPSYDAVVAHLDFHLDLKLLAHLDLDLDVTADLMLLCDSGLLPLGLELEYYCGYVWDKNLDLMADLDCGL